MEDTPSVSYGGLHQVELWGTTSSVSYGGELWKIHQVCAKQDYVKCELWKIHQV